MKTRNLVLAGIVALLVGCSTDKAPTVSAPAAARTLLTQQLLDKGREVAQRVDWRQAIHFYSLAQKKAYLSPQIMYNLWLLRIPKPVTNCWRMFGFQSGAPATAVFECQGTENVA